MKKRNRMLALLLAFTMVLTFMPMLTFAEGEEADADQQVTEAVEAEAVEAEAVEAEAETVEAEAVEEVAADVVEEQIVEEQITEEKQDVEAAAAPYPVKAVMTPEEPLWGYAGDEEVENWYRQANIFLVTFSDGKTKTFKCVKDDNGIDGYYEDGNVSNDEEYYFGYSIQTDNYRLAAGKNTVIIEMHNFDSGDVYPNLGTIDVTGEITESFVSAEYKQAKPIQAEYKQGWVAWDPDGDRKVFEGDTITVKCYESKRGEYDEENEEWIYTDVLVSYEYKCQKDARGNYSFIGKDDEGDEIDLYVKFWDDQYWDEKAKTGNWMPGETHYLTATIEGKAVDGDIVVNVKAAAAHTHKLQKIKKVAATCQHSGVKEHYECTICGDMFKDKKGKKKTTVEALTIKPTAHKYKNKKVATEEFLKTAPTCTKKGVYYYCAECTMCHQQTKAKKTYTGGSLLPHDCTKIEKVEATCQKTGMKEHYKCSICNKLYTSPTAKKATTAKKLTIKKLKHKFTVKDTSDKYKAKKAGMYYYSCEMCGAKGKKTFKAELPTE